jgi:transposase-like protein
MVKKKTIDLKTRRRFSQDFKDDAVRMVVMEGIELGQAAEKLGVDRSSLGRWKREYLGRLSQPGSGVGEMEAEIRQLRKQLRQSELQRTILKKALGILSQESIGDMSL